MIRNRSPAKQRRYLSCEWSRASTKISNADLFPALAPSAVGNTGRCCFFNVDRTSEKPVPTSEQSIYELKAARVWSGSSAC